MKIDKKRRRRGEKEEKRTQYDHIFMAKLFSPRLAFPHQHLHENIHLPPTSLTPSLHPSLIPPGGGTSSRPPAAYITH